MHLIRGGVHPYLSELLKEKIMLTITSAHSPAYNDDSNNAISLMVKFEEFAEELPFLATNYDSMQYGRQLHANAIAGMYGEIAAYVPPPPPPEQPAVTGAQEL